MSAVNGEGRELREPLLPPAPPSRTRWWALLLYVYIAALQSLLWITFSSVPLAASANPASALVAAWTPGRAVEARPKERLIPGEPAGVCVPTRSWGNSRKVEQLRWQ